MNSKRPDESSTCNENKHMESWPEDEALRKGTIFPELYSPYNPRNLNKKQDTQAEKEGSD